LAHPIVGVVDGVIDGELRGWIINKKRSQQSAQVCCHFASGKILSFSSFWYRSDVAESERIPGVFGFAIPVDLLRPMGQTCDVTDMMHVALSNGTSINLPDAPNFAPIDPINIFLHIPKTAGTSLRSNLLGDISPGEKALIYPGDPGITEMRFHQIPFYQRNRLKWIFGHTHVGIDRYVGRASRYITFIREPLARLHSNFNHHLFNESLFEFGGVQVRPSTVINEGLSEEFDNVMTRVIAGLGSQKVNLGYINESHVDLAVSNVTKLFSFVGLHSDVAHDLASLQMHLGLPARQLNIENTTPPLSSHHDSEVAVVDWDRVYRRNNADSLLYRRLIDERLVSRVLGRMDGIPAIPI
jgi:hypothetical protein